MSHWVYERGVAKKTWKVYNEHGVTICSGITSERKAQFITEALNLKESLDADLVQLVATQEGKPQ